MYEITNQKALDIYLKVKGNVKEFHNKLCSLARNDPDYCSSHKSTHQGPSHSTTSKKKIKKSDKQPLKMFLEKTIDFPKNTSIPNESETKAIDHQLYDVQNKSTDRQKTIVQLRRKLTQQVTITKLRSKLNSRKNIVKKDVKTYSVKGVQCNSITDIINPSNGM